MVRLGVGAEASTGVGAGAGAAAEGIRTGVGAGTGTAAAVDRMKTYSGPDEELAGLTSATWAGGISSSGVW